MVSYVGGVVSLGEGLVRLGGVVSYVGGSG